jgi:hypothetical protein
MGIDTTFRPCTPTYAVDSSAAVAIDARQLGVSTWRIRAVGLVAASGSAATSVYVKWASPTGSAPTAPSAPALGAPAPNVIGVNIGQTVYVEGIGADLQFIASGLYATPAYVEITGGQGGCGG